MKTILLATDGSPSAELATHQAIELAGATGRPLRVVTVWNTPIPLGYGYAAVPLPVELAKLEREHATEVAARAVATAAASGLKATSEVREGVAAEEICAAATECAATIVVLGAHGWGAVKRFLFGSVSTRVMHEAPCPVLVVRADDSVVETRDHELLRAAP